MNELVAVYRKEHFNAAQKEDLARLDATPMPSVGLLDPTGVRKGTVHKKWRLIENIYGERAQ